MGLPGRFKEEKQGKHEVCGLGRRERGPTGPRVLEGQTSPVEVPVVVSLGPPAAWVRDPDAEVTGAPVALPEVTLHS